MANLSSALDIQSIAPIRTGTPIAIAPNIPPIANFDKPSDFPSISNAFINLLLPDRTSASTLVPLPKTLNNTPEAIDAFPIVKAISRVLLSKLLIFSIKFDNVVNPSFTDGTKTSANFKPTPST